MTKKSVLECLGEILKVEDVREELEAKLWRVRRTSVLAQARAVRQQASAWWRDGRTHTHTEALPSQVRARIAHTHAHTAGAARPRPPPAC